MCSLHPGKWTAKEPKKTPPNNIHQKTTPPMIWGFPAVHFFTSWDFGRISIGIGLVIETLDFDTRCVQRSFLAPCLSPVTRHHFCGPKNIRSKIFPARFGTYRFAGFVGWNHQKNIETKMSRKKMVLGMYRVCAGCVLCFLCFSTATILPWAAFFWCMFFKGMLLSQVCQKKKTC